MAKRTTSAFWVKTVVEMLTAEGLDANRMVAEAGIDPAALDAPAARVESDQLSRLWELAAERSGNPAIGLAQHNVPRPRAFDAVGYAMMSCQNLLAGVERLERYLLILSDALTLHQKAEKDRFRLCFELYGERPVPRARAEYIMVTFIGFLRWVSGRDIHAVGIELPYPTPANLAPYREAFRCPVQFDAKGNCMIFSLPELKLPLPTSNPMLAELHDRFAGDYLRQFDHAQTSYRAREVILKRLPDGEPRRDIVARELHMSERTLQRRLEEEGKSFLQLLDDIRRELAEQYLGRLHLSLAQAAYLLGFADQSSFFRACKRWFEVSPGQYRIQLMKQLAERAGS